MASEAARPLSAQWELRCPECSFKLLLTGDLPQDLRAFDWSSEPSEVPSATNDSRSPALRELIQHGHSGGDFVAHREGKPVAAVSKLQRS